jgi:hypothetical protein
MPFLTNDESFAHLIDAIVTPPLPPASPAVPTVAVAAPPPSPLPPRPSVLTASSTRASQGGTSESSPVLSTRYLYGHETEDGGVQSSGVLRPFFHQERSPPLQPMAPPPPPPPPPSSSSKALSTAAPQQHQQPQQPQQPQDQQQQQSSNEITASNPNPPAGGV